MADSLMRLGRWAEAQDACRKALALEPRHAPTQLHLGVALMIQGKLAEAEPHLEKAVALAPRSSTAHANLGVARMRRGRWAEAERHLREGVRLDPKAVNARCDLGTVLLRRGAYPEAVTHLRKAVELDPRFIDAYGDLGRALRAQGEFAKAREALERGLALLGPEDERREDFESAAGECRRLAEGDRKLSAVLRGLAEPADAKERLLLARLCQHHRRRYAAAARFYAEAFADPRVRDTLSPGPRYDAACAAALAAAGKGKDAGSLDDAGRARLRGQALDWLQAELAGWAGLAEKAPAAKAAARARLAHWGDDPDLAGVRDESALGKLPEKERKGWRKLWADLAALRKRLGDEK